MLQQPKGRKVRQSIARRRRAGASGWGGRREGEGEERGAEGFYSLWFAKPAKARRDWWLCRRVVGRTRLTVTATHAGSGAGAMAGSNGFAGITRYTTYLQRCGRAVPA